ncbi:MAG: glycosyltransferase [Burkholderiales bacterium]
MSTFVSLGNAHQPFARLLEAVARLAPALPQPVVVQHGYTPFQGEGCEMMPFADMARFEQEVERAELLILHAGAGSVIHALRAGKVPVVAPRLARHGEHVNDHQLEFARELAKAGRIVILEDMSQLAQVVTEARARQQVAQEKPPAPAMLRLIAEELAACAARPSK